MKMNLNKIKAAQYNPREISDEAFRGLVYSLEKFGLVQPLIVNKRSGNLVGGHQRLKAMKSLGHTEADVIEVDLDDIEEKALNISLNNKEIEGDFTEGLAKLLQEVRDELPEDYDKLLLNGLEALFPLPDDRPDGADEDAVPEPLPDPIVRLGEVWILGDHRLMCGDSTVRENVDRLMDGAKADMVFTDPPYGMKLDADYSGMVNKDGIAGNNHRNIEGDDKDFDPSMIFEFFGYCDEVLLFGADYYADKIPERNSGSWLVWDKRVEEKYDKVIGSGFELLWSKKRRKRELIRFEYSSWGARMADNSEGKKPHPTMKPTGLLESILNKVDGHAVVDLFLGSGSTLIACEKTNRKCYGLEIDSHYCGVILDRWANYTGKDPEREDGKKWSALKVENERP